VNRSLWQGIAHLPCGTFSNDLPKCLVDVFYEPRPYEGLSSAYPASSNPSESAHTRQRKLNQFVIIAGYPLDAFPASVPNTEAGYHRPIRPPENPGSWVGGVQPVPWGQALYFTFPTFHLGRTLHAWGCQHICQVAYLQAMLYVPIFLTRVRGARL
jgi:hypothetical protein